MSLNFHNRAPAGQQKEAQQRLMTAQTGDDIALLRESVRRFANDEVAPIADEIDAANEFPSEMW